MAEFKIDLNLLSPKPSERIEVDQNLIGEGGFGRVYRAKYHHSLVAVKIINERVLSDEAKEQIKKECELMRNLHYDSIGRLFGYSLEEKNACIVMELAELGSLYSILQNHTQYPDIPWATRLTIASDIAKGVSFLHCQLPPVIHRDLKSLNALLRKNWSAFIVDFGLSKVKTDSQSAGTKHLGSYPWMAPEMSDDEAITTIAVDVYAFAMILYELLTRQIPWRGVSQIKVIKAVDKGERPVIPDEKICPSVKGCPIGYIKLMQDCWIQEAKNRPQMSEVIARLEQLQGSTKETQSQVLSSIQIQSSLVTFSPPPVSSAGSPVTLASPPTPAREEERKNFIESLLSPLGLYQDYGAIFVEEGYDCLSAVSELSAEEMKSMKIKGGHQKMILKAIQSRVSSASVTSTTSNTSSPAPALPRRSSSPPPPPPPPPSSPTKVATKNLIQRGHWYRTGTGGVKQNHAESFRLYQEAASQGDDEAEAWVAFCYLRGGMGTPKNDQEAFRLSMIGVAKNVPLAYANLGFCYHDGKGVEKDLKEAVRLYQKGVELDDPASQGLLGFCYSHGEGVAKDEKLAVRYFRLAADQGDIRAQNNLGSCYRHGEGVTKDLKAAARYFRIAADQGLALAQVNLALCYSTGDGVEKNATEEIRYYLLAADQGNASAQYLIGRAYRIGDGVKVDLKEAIRYYRLAADQGHGNAQLNLGICYRTGEGVEMDQKEAVRYLQLAANQGVDIAQGVLGNCYLAGIGIGKDPKEATRYFRLAATQGSSTGQSGLGICYLTGTGIEKNEREAVRYLRLAAEQGCERAQYNLGLCYRDGLGVKQVFEEAVRLFRLAAEKGDSDAQHSLGYCYQHGTGVAKDFKEAVHYYRLSVAQKNMLSQFNLGMIYEQGGFGVRPDFEEALRLYQLAAAQGYEDAKTAVRWLQLKIKQRRK